MTKEKKIECKNCIKKAKEWYKSFGRKSGPVSFIQTNNNTISEMEIAVRYLIKQGYHFTINHGTNNFFRTCYINID
jgi:ribulose bisphosphate carboxylase small subunit